VPLKPKYFNPVLARRVFLYPFLDEEKNKHGNEFDVGYSVLYYWNDLNASWLKTDEQTK
jgi:hypothetical protein